MDDDPGPAGPSSFTAADAPMARHGHQQRTFWSRYRIEITAVVVLKVALIFLAKQLWFSEPVARHMQVEPQRIEQQLLGNPATAGAKAGTRLDAETGFRIESRTESKAGTETGIRPDAQAGTPSSSPRSSP